MNKPEFISSIAEKSGMKKKESEAMLDAFVASVKEALKKGDEVRLIGFGLFGTRDRKKRNGVNPRTGKKITIPAKTVPYFKVGKELKDAVK
ncbi:MAG: integration host factor [Caldisericum sp. CG2_30_36_11]|nr:HU family DNA-binding protein [Caldisericota bacterium]OIP12465.1 MAG: integration host factor [Caldisericum sp. CG2_30_36_11]PIW11164.1 MAG: integration host factor [Caldiserica bacterium CG17_big_fil_post_rev_8_21_14_2_50_35_7]PIX29550.1 MAG: integration host factor [Caldiserica bacterium CG_4_8_14_3_um_filter_35_18]